MAGPYNIQILRGLAGNRSLLSTDGVYRGLDLWIEDDGSGRQQWEITPVAGQSAYTINVVPQQRNRYLSFGTGSLVFLSPADTGTGTEWWTFRPVQTTPAIPSYYQIVPSTGSKYLSTGVQGVYVDLWGTDDGSGRQRWQLQGPPLML